MCEELEFYWIYDCVKVQVVVEFEEIVVQCGDMYVGWYVDGDLCVEYFCVGLYGVVMGVLQVFDGDVLVIEEIGQLEQDVWFVRGDYFDDVWQQVGLCLFGGGVVLDQFQVFFVFQLGQYCFEFGY